MSRLNVRTRLTLMHGALKAFTAVANCSVGVCGETGSGELTLFSLFKRSPLVAALVLLSCATPCYAQGEDSYTRATAAFHQLRTSWADIEKVQRAFKLAESQINLTQADYTEMAQYDRWRFHAMDGVQLMKRALRLFPTQESLAELARCEYEAGLVVESQASLARLVRGDVPKSILGEVSWLAWKVAKKTWELTIELKPDPINAPKGFIQRRGYYVFYTRPDTAYQKKTVRWTEARKAEWVTDSAGNEILKLWPNDWHTPVVVKMIVAENPVNFKLVEREVPPGEMPEDVRKYLGDSPLGPAKTRPLINPTGTAAIQMAKTLKGANRAATIENIRNWVMGNVKYADTLDPNSSAGSAQKDSELVLQNKRGFCWENAKAMVAVLRAAGIPARRVLVLNIFPPNNQTIFPKDVLTGGHVMAEYWDPVGGWIPVQDRPAAVCGMVGFVIASELADESDPNGTPERVFTESYYGGGNGKDPYVNMTIRSLQYTFAP